MSKYKWNTDYKKLMENKRKISSKQAAAVLTGAALFLTPYSLQATGTTIHNPTQNIVAAESDEAIVNTNIDVETELETTVELIDNTQEDVSAVIETDTGVESGADVEVETDTGLDSNAGFEVDDDTNIGAEVDPNTGDPADVEPSPGGPADVDPNAGDPADVAKDLDSNVNVDVDQDVDSGVNVDVDQDVDSGVNVDVDQDVGSDVNVDVDQEVEVDLDTIVTTHGNLVANFLEAEQTLQLFYTISYENTLQLTDSYYIITLSNELAANIKSVSYVGLQGTQAVAVEGNTITIPAAQVINESVNLELLIEYVTAPTTGNFNVSIGQYLSGSETIIVNSGSNLTVTVPEAGTDTNVDSGTDIDQDTETETETGTGDDSHVEEDQGAGINGDLDNNEDSGDNSGVTTEEDQDFLVSTGHDDTVDDSAGHLLPVTANNWWNMALAGVAALAAGIGAKLYRFRRQFN